MAERYSLAQVQTPQYVENEGVMKNQGYLMTKIAKKFVRLCLDRFARYGQIIGSGWFGRVLPEKDAFSFWSRTQPIKIIAGMARDMFDSMLKQNQRRRHGGVFASIHEEPAEHRL